MKNKMAVTALALTVFLGACSGNRSAQNDMGYGASQWDRDSRKTMSSYDGGEGRLWTTSGGALAGSAIGKSFSSADRMCNQQAWDRAYLAPLNHRVAWNNPDSGHYGYIVPVREGTSLTSGVFCREYRQTTFVSGQTETTYGTACRNDNGTWSLPNT